MFEINKKGSDKGPDTAPQRADSGNPVRAESGPTARRVDGPRDAAVIGPSIYIDGDLRGEEDLLIEGEVNGTVQLKNNSLTIGPQGKIRADVYAQTIFVDGLMEGDLYGSERVTVRKSAQVRGNIISPRVSLEDGSKFKGSIEMDPQAVQGALGANRPAPKSQPAQARPPSPKPPEAKADTGPMPSAAAAKNG
jgi:cytoskeletal protein CcmA (bactofilin family)